jgi:hypothetical protein
MGTVHQTIGTMSAAKAGSHRLQGRGAQGQRQYPRDEFGKKLHNPTLYYCFSQGNVIAC